MRERRRRAMRAAVLGCSGARPGARRARGDCTHTGGVNGTATLTFAAGDGTVTLSQDADGALTFAVGAAPPRCAGRRRSTNIAQINVVGSASADMLVVDLTAGLFARPDGR